MPPRLQCLSTVRNSISIPSLGMRFSTSRVALDESPPTSGEPTLNAMQSLLQAAQEIRDAKLARLRRVAAENSHIPQSLVQETTIAHARSDLTKQIHRRWRAGDVYAPHDLTGVEMAKWKKRGKVTRDVFDVVAFDPIASGSYKNFSIMSEYVTPMGRIRGSKETGLRPVNQRKIAKAVRRSIGLGMMPSVHRHPEVLYKAKEKAEANDDFKSGRLV